uniref:Reverse transcriptase Ty1/copia-type domain-containing protein n=1 Tax=Tanacetum cinerariifolium TaxID=118510 RepID=A0A699K566_TANCI|nr:hypothetical protein [Tanacetum cinerariifolium]
MSSMGELTLFLGLQVKQKKDGIFISQDKYVAQILRKFRLSKGKSASTPIDADKPLLKNSDGEDVNVHTYRSMIGSLMYLTSSRTDIMFAVCACARFQVTPKVSHLNAVKRIFRYLKGKPCLGLWYPKDSPFDLVAYSNSDYAGASLDRKYTTAGCQFLGCRLISSHLNAVKRIFRYLKGKPYLGLWYLKDSPFDLVSYSDSDYAGASLDRKSTTRGCQFIGCRLIFWQCKKQIVIATFLTKAEYVAAASGCAQVLWIQNQLLDYGNMVIEIVVLNILSDALPITTNGVQLTMSNTQERVDLP